MVVRRWIISICRLLVPVLFSFSVTGCKTPSLNPVNDAQDSEPSSNTTPVPTPTPEGGEDEEDVVDGSGLNPDVGNPSVLSDSSAPSVSVAPASGSTIDRNQSIVFSFSESIRQDSKTLGGTLSASSNGGVWSTVSQVDDRLTVSPSANWPSGSGKTLTLRVSDLAGNFISELTVTYTVSSLTVYVHEDGDDSNTGTANSPFASLQVAIDYVYANGGGVVKISEGSFDASATVTLKTGVSVYGGYLSSDWNVRDSIAHPTILNNIQGSGGSQANPISTLELVSPGGGLVVDGLEINGGSVSHSSGMTLQSTYDFTIQNCRISGGNSSETNTGIKMTATIGATSVVQNNTIEGGAGKYSWGMRLEGAGVVSGNTIRGGTGTKDTFGIRVSSAAMVTVSGNTVEGGSGGVSSTGIYNDVSAATYSNNTIDGGTSETVSYGMYFYSNVMPRPTVTGNFIQGGDGSVKTYGVFAYTDGIVFSGNRIHGGAATQESHGVYVSGSDSQFFNNLIYGGSSGDVSYGVRTIGNDDHTFINNIINSGFGGNGAGSVNAAYGIYVGGSDGMKFENNLVSTAGASTTACFYHYAHQGTWSVKNNSFFNCGDLVMVDRQGLCDGNGDGDNDSQTCSVSDLNAYSGGSDNLGVDPLFVDLDGADDDLDTLADNDWSFQAGSPASVTTGGLDQSASWDFSTDFLGESRTAAGGLGWSIGAFERD